MRDYDFTEIIRSTGDTRPVMSRPPKLIATKKWVRQVQDAATEAGGDMNALADWVLNAMEEYAAWTARPVFDMEGNGPQCSVCHQIWPLCGHHHMSHIEGVKDVE